jgi:hypothetical protein
LSRAWRDARIRGKRRRWRVLETAGGTIGSGPRALRARSSCHVVVVGLLSRRRVLEGVNGLLPPSLGVRGLLLACGLGRFRGRSVVGRSPR